MSKVNSRAKGIRGELEAAKLFRRWFPDCQRTFGQSRKGGEEAPDIGSPEMNKHFYVEVKRYKKITEAMVIKWWDKCVRDSGEFEAKNLLPIHSLDPVLMYRADGVGEWGVTTVLGNAHSWGDFADETDQSFEIKGDSK